MIHCFWPAPLVDGCCFRKRLSTVHSKNVSNGDDFIPCYKGIMDLHPRTINRIPSKAHLEIDSHIDENRRNIVIEEIHQPPIAISKKRRIILLIFDIVNQDPLALSDILVITTMESAAWELKLT